MFCVLCTDANYTTQSADCRLHFISDSINQINNSEQQIDVISYYRVN